MFSKSWTVVRSLHRNNVRNFTDLVRIVEVGPRDGLQNVKTILPTSLKIELINRLSETGLRSIEATSFVSPKWIPQMADGLDVWQGINKKSTIDYPILVPNLEGARKAIKNGVKEVILVASTTESFARANLNCTIDESLKRCDEIRELCKSQGIKARVALSCCLGCPYEGEVDRKTTAKLAERLLNMGFYEVSLADTIGVGTPKRIKELFGELKCATGGEIWRFAVHLHDTYGQALVNVYECLEQGVRVFDSSVAGLGGCPYAPGATGNVSTEDLLYLLHGLGMETGVDLDKVIEVGHFVCEKIPTSNQSKVGNAILTKKINSNNEK